MRHFQVELIRTMIYFGLFIAFATGFAISQRHTTETMIATNSQN